MSDARLVITALFVDHQSPALDGRRPRQTLSGHGLVKLILDLRTKLSTVGLDAGPETIVWQLTQHHNRVVARTRLVAPEPRKRPRSSYVRSEPQVPNETRQSDFTDYRLHDGRDVEIITWLDDHARYALQQFAERADLLRFERGASLRRLGRCCARTRSVARVAPRDRQRGRRPGPSQWSLVDSRW